MFSEFEAGVVIADGGSGIRLSRAGEVGLGYPTLIDVRAGPFSGSVKDDIVGDYGCFLSAIETLYESLAGNATLGSYDGYSRSFDGTSRGGINVSVVGISEPVPSIGLTLDFQIDQSYLPKIISGIRHEFPLP